MNFEQIYDIINSLAAQHSDKLPKDEDLCANLIITGSTSGTIGVSMFNGRLTVQQELFSPADAEVTASADDLMALFSGKLNPLTAVMTGRLKISGDMAKLMKLMAKYKK